MKLTSYLVSRRLLFRSVRTSVAAALSFVVIAAVPVIMLSSPASALTTPESDCLSLIGGGAAGSNYSTTASCERAVNSDTWYIGGYDIGSSFTGHLEFVFAGNVVTNAPVSGEITYGNASYSIEYQSTGCPGNWQTILWRDNGGGNYTNMGEAQIAVTCDLPTSTPSKTSTVTVRQLSHVTWQHTHLVNPPVAKVTPLSPRSANGSPYIRLVNPPVVKVTPLTSK